MNDDATAKDAIYALLLIIAVLTALATSFVLCGVLGALLIASLLVVIVFVGWV